MNNEIKFNKKTLLILSLFLISLSTIFLITYNRSLPKHPIAHNEETKEKTNGAFFLEKSEKDKGKIAVLEVEPSKDNMTLDAESETIPSE